MLFNTQIYTDVGNTKKTNQDSMCLIEARTNKGKVLLAIVCDGMGGLEKGEVASATVIQKFSNWFESTLPQLLVEVNYVDEIRYSWERLIKEENQNIAEHGRKYGIQLGTTLTAMLFFEDGNFLIGHVGDSRVYKITDNSISVLTEDQTLVEREVKLGHLSRDQIETDPRKNVLLQCIGASRIVEPVFIEGRYEKNECYMLCSDGFRHTLSQKEIWESFKPSSNYDENTMKNNLIALVELNKKREETDNISVILIKIV